MTMYIHQDWPRDLIHKATGVHKDFKRPEDVPPGWFTVDGEEVNPDPDVVQMTPKDPYVVSADQVTNAEKFEAQDDASEQTLRDLRGGGSDPKPRGKRRGRRHSELERSDPGVSDVEETG
jgi:hypothetical protein